MYKIGIFIFALWMAFGIVKNTLSGDSYSNPKSKGDKIEIRNPDEPFYESGRVIKKRAEQYESRTLSKGKDFSSCRGGERMLATWYGPGFHGNTMANGERFDKRAYTVAHKTLPLGSTVCIENPRNGKVVIAKVTDRGPYRSVYAPGRPARDIDLSQQVANVLDILEEGVAPLIVKRMS